MVAKAPKLDDLSFKTLPFLATTILRQRGIGFDGKTNKVADSRTADEVKKLADSKAP